MHLDHVIIAASTRPPETPWLAAEHGLELSVGGEHPGWGTCNWIVALGDAYLELVAVVDEDVARASSFGSRALESGDGGLIGWAVRPDDFDATAGRLRLDVGEGSRTRPSGECVEWRMAGLDVAMDRPWLPFFIAWRDPAAFPGATPSSPARIVRLELECDAEELSDWLGPHSLPLDVRAGDAGVTAVILDGPQGTIALGRPRAS
jgi:Glyoxalase-like domain